MAAGRTWIMGRYRPPQIHGNGARLSGYNSVRQKNAMDRNPLSAEVTQDAREQNPVFSSIPPPDAPIRDPKPETGLQLDPDLAVQAAIAAKTTMPDNAPPGFVGPYGSEVMQRNTTTPGIDTKLITDAGPDAPLNSGVEALSEDPLPLTPGEHAGTAMRQALNSAGIDVKSPDIKSILPALGQIGESTLKDVLGPPQTPEQAGLRNAQADAARSNAKLRGNQANEVAPNAQSKRELEGAQTDLAGARTDQVDDKLANPPAPKTDTRGAAQATANRIRALHEQLAELDREEKGAPSAPAHFWSKDERTPIINDIQTRRAKVMSQLEQLSNAPTEETSAVGSERSPEEIAAEKEVEQQWPTVSAQEKDTWINQARKELKDPNAKPEDIAFAKAILKKAGV